MGNLPDSTGILSLDKTIGLGTYGRIYLGLHDKTGSFTTVKVMNAWKTRLPEIGKQDEEEDPRTELNLLRKYSFHKNSVSFYGAFFKLSPPGHRSQRWMVMELCTAGSDTDIVRMTRNQSLKDDWIAYICREILQGLAHLHTHQVIHPDIKGQNVLLTRNAEVKLVDFGVRAQVSGTNGRRNSFIGTPYWMAPEMINCDEDPRLSYGYRSDVCSVGITAIEMAEGVPSLCNLQPLEAFFVILQESAPTIKSSGWSCKLHNFMEKCMIKKFLFRPTSRSMLHHPFVLDIKNEQHVVESLIKHLTGIIKKRQKKDTLPIFEREAAIKELYTTRRFRGTSCAHELLTMPTSSRYRPLIFLHGEAPQPRWLPDQEEPYVHALQQLRVPMPLHAQDNTPKPLQIQALAPGCLYEVVQVFMPLQMQVKAKASTLLLIQIEAPLQLRRAARVHMPLPTQEKEPEVQATIPKEQQAQSAALGTEQPKDLDQVPEEFQQQDRASEQERQGQAAEQQQRQNPAPEQNRAPEQPEVQEQAAEPPQDEIEDKEPELVQVHAQVVLPLLSQNHHVLLPLHLDTQLLIPVGEHNEEAPQAQAWALETSQAVGTIQALIEGLSRDLLQAPNACISKPLGPLQILMENLASNVFYTQPEQTRKKKSRVSSLKHALAKRLSRKRFRAKSFWRCEDFELSDLEAGRRRRQRRWEDIFNQHEEELRQVQNNREDDSSDNDEVFHSIQAEVQIEQYAQNPTGNEVQERSAPIVCNRDRTHRVKFSPSVCEQPVLEEVQQPMEIRQGSSLNPQNGQAESESSSEEESPVTRRKSQSSPPYSTIDQNLLIDIHVPDGFKVGKISPPVYLTNDWVGYNALSEIFWDEWLIPEPVIQPPEEDGDYVELYDADANTDGEEEDSNDAYEENSDHDNDEDGLNDQVDEANAHEDHADGDFNDGSVHNIDDNAGAVNNDPRAEDYRRGILKQAGGGECESFRDCRNDGAKSNCGNTASGASAAFGNQEGHGASMGNQRGNRGVNGNSEENGACGFNREGTDSQNNGPGLAQQDFGHEQEESDGGTETLNSIALGKRSLAHNAYNKPLIHVYEKEFTSEICCGSLWGVNLLLGTRTSLYLMDRSGKADIIKLIKRRPFCQIQVVEPLNLLITISGHKNRLRVYHLTWLRNKILNNDPESKKRQKEMLKTEEACKAIDKLTGCEHFSVLQHEETTYIAVALKSSIHLYAWAPKSFDESTAIKVFPTLDLKPVTVDLAVGSEKTLKIFFSSANGYHIIDAESEVMSDVALPNNNLVILPDRLGIGVMLTFNAETASEEANEQLLRKILDVWKDIPSSVAFECTQRITGWDQKAIEVRSLQSSILENELKRRSIKKLRFLCGRGDKLFFASILKNRHSRVYFMTLGKLEELKRNYAV